MDHCSFFSVERDDSIYTDDLVAITKFIVGHFQELGADFDFATRDIAVRPAMPNPKFLLAADDPSLRRDTIYLTCRKCSLWCKAVFQAAHELTHCYIYCHNKNERLFVGWIEESICEAMALYFLKYFYDNWHKFELSVYNHGYGNAFYEYLNDILNEHGTSRLSNARSKADLAAIEKTCTKRREDRKCEVDALYDRITPDRIYGLLCYRDFTVTNDIILNTREYKNKFPFNSAVAYLCDIQDKIIK